MSSDTANTAVIAIQGNSVVAETLTSSQDGYVLTWDNTDGYIAAKPSVGLQSQVFTSSGTWTCPTNVFNVWLNGFGGGGGGGGSIAQSNYCPSGGGGSIQFSGCVAVTPNTTYTIVIGIGGYGGTSGGNGSDGSPSSFDTLFYAQGGGGGIGVSTQAIFGGGNNFPGSDASNTNTNPIAAGGGPGYSIISVDSLLVAPSGNINWFGNGSYIGGTGGLQAHGTTYAAGAGGGAGPCGNGATGADGQFGSSPSNGSSAADNTGAGGGAGGSSNTAGGAGGNGGSGQLTVSWIG